MKTATTHQPGRTRAAARQAASGKPAPGKPAADKPALGNPPRKAAAGSRPAASRAAPARTARGEAAAKPAPQGEPRDKPRKPKLVRDSFTIPKNEYGAIERLKTRAALAGRPAKKSELLRAGLMALESMGDPAFLAAVKAVPLIKTGRPAKG